MLLTARHCPGGSLGVQTAGRVDPDEVKLKWGGSGILTGERHEEPNQP